MITRKFLIIGRLQRRLLMIRMGTFGPCCRNQMTTFSSTKNLFQFRSMSDNVGNEFVKIGAVKVPIQKAKNSELVPIGFGKSTTIKNQPSIWAYFLRYIDNKEFIFSMKFYKKFETMNIYKNILIHNPQISASGNQPQQFVRTLKWMLQKDALKQDIFLIGQPGFLRANIVFQFLV